MNRRHRIHRLHLKNQFVLNQQINPIPYIRQLPTVIHNRHRHFSQSMNATLRKLISEACLYVLSSSPGPSSLCTAKAPSRTALDS
ncbi:MAG: hypothetical protein JWQ49_5496 [Edaphobacter sp.]|nr:hypothetical protein [Edaphobacter sp.]